MQIAKQCENIISDCILDEIKVGLSFALSPV
jgi:hypothetical protein